jgi:hypothetical protein
VYLVVAARRGPRAGDATLTARIGGTLHAAMERIVGTDRADTIADRTRDLGDRITELARDGREKLRRSEHATLIVAIGAGAILIAIVVALGGALDGSDEPVAPAPTSATTAAATTASGAAKTGAKADKQAAPVKPVIPPARLTVDVYNAGSQKGKAKTVADKVKGYGYKIGAVTNAKSSYGTSTIIHPADMTREARTLARRTGITNLQVAPGSTRKITLIVT